MADLTKIYTGMSTGPEAIQNNFDAINQTVENMGEQLNQLQWSDIKTDGLITTDGWGLLPANRNSGYQTAKLGNKTAVWFHPIIQRLDSNFNGSKTWFILRVPHNISPIAYQLNGDIDSRRCWNYVADNGFSVSAIGDVVKDDNWVKDNLYAISTFYLAN